MVGSEVFDATEFGWSSEPEDMIPNEWFLTLKESESLDE